MDKKDNDLIEQLVAFSIQLTLFPTVHLVHITALYIYIYIYIYDE